MASRGECDDDRLAIEADRAAEQAVDAEDGARELGAPGADQAGEAEDLAAADGEARSAGPDRWRSAPRSISSTLAPGGAAGGMIERLEVAADHQADHGVVGDVAAIERADHAAVAQHHDAVGAASRPRSAGGR